MMACRKGHELDCVRGTGEQKQEDREVEPFTSLALYDNIDLVLRQGDEQQIRVEGGEHVVDGIRVELENGLLMIENENYCDWVRDPKQRLTVHLTVTPEQLYSIEFHGSGQISCETPLDIDVFNVNVYGATGSGNFWVVGDHLRCLSRNGSSDLTFEGRVRKSYVYLGGVGHVYQHGLQAEEARVKHEGLGDAYIGPSKELSISIFEKGSVYYGGQPDLTELLLEGEGMAKPLK